MPIDPPPFDDEGLYEERTQLAWSRSGIAVLVCILVLLRRVWPLDRADHVLAVLLVAAGALVWAVGWLLARRSTHPVDGREDAVLTAATVRALSVGTFMLAVAGFVLAILPPPSS